MPAIQMFVVVFIVTLWLERMNKLSYDIIKNWISRFCAIQFPTVQWKKYLLTRTLYEKSHFFETCSCMFYCKNKDVITTCICMLLKRYKTKCIYFYKTKLKKQKKTFNSAENESSKSYKRFMSSLFKVSLIWP